MSQPQTLAKNSPITVRQTRISDANKLPEIEYSAGQLFSTIEDLSWISTGDVQDIGSHLASIEKQSHWVAVNENDEPVGFIMTADLPESLFIHEISVSSAWQNKGIGKQLIQKVIDEAKARQYSAVTLTTFRHVVWNAPFYQRLGFVILPENEIPFSLQKILDNEVNEAGFERAARCAMKLKI